LPDEPTATHAAQQAYRAYLTLQQALHALPADHPATPGVAHLTTLAVRHWQAQRQTVGAAQPQPDGHRPAALRAVA
jgi:hypothetical protein